jgi:hypothetical protein
MERDYTAPGPDGLALRWSGPVTGVGLYIRADKIIQFFIFEKREENFREQAGSYALTPH